MYSFLCCFSTCRSPNARNKEVNTDNESEASLVPQESDDYESSVTNNWLLSSYSSCAYETFSETDHLKSYATGNADQVDFGRIVLSPETPEEDLENLKSPCLSVESNKTVIEKLQKLSQPVICLKNKNPYAKSQINLTFFYNELHETLDITVNYCRHLPAADRLRNTSNPYVQVYLLPDTSASSRRKTQVRWDTLNPNFEETLSPSYRLSKANVDNYQLWITVWQAHGGHYALKALKREGRRKRICLGEAIVRLREGLICTLHDLTFPLEHPEMPLKLVNELEESLQVPVGVLYLKLKFVPKYDYESLTSPEDLESPNKATSSNRKIHPHTLGSLEIRIASGKDLPVRNSGKPPKAFCKCYLINVKGEGKPSQPLRQQTLTENSTCNPKWNHTIIYHNFSLDQLKDCCLEITVWDNYNKIKKTLLGGVRLASNSQSGSQTNISKCHFIDSEASEADLWKKLVSGQYRFWIGAALKLRYFTPVRAASRNSEELIRGGTIHNSFSETSYFHE